MIFHIFASSLAKYPKTSPFGTAGTDTAIVTVTLYHTSSKALLQRQPTLKPRNLTSASPLLGVDVRSLQVREACRQKSERQIQALRKSQALMICVSPM